MPRKARWRIKTTKTMCDEQAALVQTSSERKMSLCDGADGASLIHFSDRALQTKFDRMLMKGSQNLLRSALLGAEKVKVPSFLQEGESKNSQPMTKATAKVPVTSGQNDEFGDLKCGPIPDCGLLYDTLSLEWGGYKDQVDELKKKMADNAAA